MEVGIEFQLIWHDNDVLNLRVWAWNGAFGGVAEIYEAVGDLHVAASNLRGRAKRNLREQTTTSDGAGRTARTGA